MDIVAGSHRWWGPAHAYPCITVVAVWGSARGAAPDETGGAEAADGVARRKLMSRAAAVGFLMRTVVNIVVPMVALLDPDSGARPVGRLLLAALACWSLYRIVTRRLGPGYLVVDYLLAISVCLGIPVLVQDPAFFTYNTAPLAIAGTTVIGFAVALPASVAFAMTAVVAAAYAIGSAQVVGWAAVGGITAVYYFGLQWATAALIRAVLLRVAVEVDRSRAERYAAQLRRQVSDAVHEYEREQLALLHDTAASTLMMVGQAAVLPPDRLAAQARRDLELLGGSPWIAPPQQIELVAALRDCVAHLSIPATFRGRKTLWLDGETATAVVSASREAMTNAERHSRASCLTVSVGVGAVVLADDGVGFDPEAPRSGHGISASIIARMRRAGGSAAIHSEPGFGVSVELSWRAPEDGVSDEPVDPERLIERTRIGYGLALTAYAVANLAVSAPQVMANRTHLLPDATLFVFAVVAALTAVPAILGARWCWSAVGAALLVVVTVGQPLVLSVDDLGGQAHWAQNTVGWCVLPLIMRLAVCRGVAVLVLFWLLGAAVQFARNPGTATLVNLAFGTASILAVQLFALMFNWLMRGAALDAAAETAARQQLIARDEVAKALRAEYQRRYAEVVGNVVPLLQRLAHGESIGERLQRSARTESRRLRALFDHAAIFENPLMRALRPLVDAAEAREVDVSVDVVGELPILGESQIAGLLAPVDMVLEAATVTARIVVNGAPEEVGVSVVVSGPDPVAALPMRGSDVDVLVGEDAVWVVSRTADTGAAK